MRSHKLIGFIFRAITVGLAAAFVVVYFYPELIGTSENVVEFRESPQADVRNTAGGDVVGPSPHTYADAVDIAAPAVVNIFTKKVVNEEAHPFLDDPVFRRFFGGDSGAPRQRVETSLGSGVIVSASGYVLTNNHVIAGAEEIQIALRDGRNAVAQLVGSDPDTDLSVLRIELPELPTITLGRSDNLRVGDVVLAIGNPYGVGQTVTSGIVSATGRTQLGINTFENFIQTDAAINPGNSGGALVNPLGELIGINTAIFSRTGGSQGIGFAIPVSLAKGVLTQIVENGQVIRGWLGVEIQDLTGALAESFGVKHEQGVVVAGVFDGSPAERAGLQRGDVITEIAGKPVGNVNSALELIAGARPESVLEIGGLRKGAPFSVDAQIVRRAPEQMR